MKEIKPIIKCGYKDFCYLAEGADCFGYMSDCPLYQASNDSCISEASFHKAMDTLIDKTKLKHSKIQK
ncbi:MAG: hypothetical protein GY839_14675 [candidate division Zixibacteria bacterium]|nr:hypothetical protein [candidate division Zixibacteria bacterium]